MIRSTEQTPKYYSRNSRDFQLLCRLFDAAFNTPNYRADTIVNNYTEHLVDGSVLELLAGTLNFKQIRTYQYDDLQKIVFIFKWLIREKGTKWAIKKLVNAITNVYGIENDYTEMIEFGKNEVSIYLPKVIEDTNIVYDVLDYILPVGYIVKIYQSDFETSKDTDELLYWDVVQRFVSSHNELSQISIDYNHESNLVNTISTPTNPKSTLETTWLTLGDPIVRATKEYTEDVDTMNYNGQLVLYSKHPFGIEMLPPTELGYKDDDITQIVYTTNGQPPINDNGTVYIAPIMITHTQNFLVQVKQLGGYKSKIISVLAIVNQSASPIINPTSGNYIFRDGSGDTVDTKNVAINTATNQTILYYTTDGSDPITYPETGRELLVYNESDKLADSNYFTSFDELTSATEFWELNLEGDNIKVTSLQENDYAIIRGTDSLTYAVYENGAWVNKGNILSPTAIKATSSAEFSAGNSIDIKAIALDQQSLISTISESKINKLAGFSYEVDQVWNRINNNTPSTDGSEFTYNESTTNYTPLFKDEELNNFISREEFDSATQFYNNEQKQFVSSLNNNEYITINNDSEHNYYATVVIQEDTSKTTTISKGFIFPFTLA